MTAWGGSEWYGSLGGSAAQSRGALRMPKLSEAWSRSGFSPQERMLSLASCAFKIPRCRVRLSVNTGTPLDDGIEVPAAGGSAPSSTAAKAVSRENPTLSSRAGRSASWVRRGQRPGRTGGIGWRVACGHHLGARLLSRLASPGVPDHLENNPQNLWMDLFITGRSPVLVK